MPMWWCIPVPRALRTENIFDRVRAVATRHNVNLHDVSVQDLSGQLHVEQHLELDERLSLKEAHDRVTVIEAEIRSDVPEVSSILTHIESEPATIESGNEVLRDAALEKKLKAIAGEFPEIFDMHDVQIKRVRGRLYISCHCTLSDELVALAGARYIDRVGNPLQTGSARVVSRADSSRAEYR